MKLYLYSDLDGKLTGEFSTECAGQNPDGSPCQKHVQKWANEVRISCAPPTDQRGCRLTLIISTGANGKTRIRKKCNTRICGGASDCRKCRVASMGKSLTILDPDGPVSRVRQVEEFRCSCEPFEHSARLREFLNRDLCQMIAAALADGSDLTERDFFHCHLIIDEFEDSDVVGIGDSPIFSEKYLLEHYRGMLGHMHEYDGKREQGAHANIWVGKGEKPTFIGGSDALSPVDLTPPSASMDSLYFRWADPRVPCPPCTWRVECPDMPKAICVGIRSDWPEGDPALGL
jgi:hypothetical protein